LPWRSTEGNAFFKEFEEPDGALNPDPDPEADIAEAG
jgi:hypothetical protein